jgi:hypothetical protein
MEYIRQKLGLTNRGLQEVAYTIVITTDWTLPLSEYPCMIEHPELFEITSDPIPENAQYLYYQ